MRISPYLAYRQLRLLVIANKQCMAQSFEDAQNRQKKQTGAQKRTIALSS